MRNRNKSTDQTISAFKRGAKPVYLSKLAAGDHFIFENLPDVVYKVVRKYPNAFTIKPIAQDEGKTIAYYPSPQDTDENKVWKLTLKSEPRKSKEPVGQE